jgi:hypothetical protein
MGDPTQSPHYSMACIIIDIFLFAADSERLSYTLWFRSRRHKGRDAKPFSVISSPRHYASQTAEHVMSSAPNGLTVAVIMSNCNPFWALTILYSKSSDTMPMSFLRSCLAPYPIHYSLSSTYLSRTLTLALTEGFFLPYFGWVATHA